MIIRTELIQPACSTILAAVDSSNVSAITETLELKAQNNTLFLNVTNKEYYASVKLPVDYKEEFHATVNAVVFLKLISQITTETVELTVKGNTLMVKANGNYKLPLIYDGEQLLELPTIHIDNVTANFPIPTKTLLNILNFNTKEITKAAVVNEINKLYYVDENGCITFTTGACINNFKLPKSVKFILNQKIVKLFKLFNNTENVNFSLGYDAISETITQTKVKFENEIVSITAILSVDDRALSSFPVGPIRQRAEAEYKHSVVISRIEAVEALNRLSLFSTVPYCVFEFEKGKVTICDSAKENNEEIYYKDDVDYDLSYSCMLDPNDVKATLENCTEEYLTINFGDEQAIIITRNNIVNVIPEVHPLM